jgi:N-formylglutamate deformylase
VDAPQLLLHIPHSSTAIPEDVRSRILLDDRELQAEIIALTDLHTDVLYRVQGVATVRYPFCRLVADPERFRDDADEPMAIRGHGAVYVETADGRPLRVLEPGEREVLLKRFYDPHHEAVSAEVQRILARHGRCLIVDAHSFPSSPLPYEDPETSTRPDLCVGTCDYHTSESLVVEIERAARQHGLSLERNRPYSGTLTPARYYRKDKRVRSVMIEVNRSLYMDQRTGEQGPGFAEIQDFLKAVIEALAVIS